MIRIKYISLFIFVFIGIFADFIANDKPLICKNKEGYTFPVFSDKYRVNQDNKCEIILNPIIHYSNNSIDKLNAGSISPFGEQNLAEKQQRHYLGTDLLGRDVLAGLIHGTTIALKIGFSSMFLALILGLMMSLYPSYFGDFEFKAKLSSLLITIILLFFTVYFLYYKTAIISILTTGGYNFIFIPALFLGIIIALWFTLSKINIFTRQILIPLDSMFSTVIKLFQSLPGTFVVLILISLFTKPSIYNIIIVIAILKWPIIARYVRAEMLKIKQERFIEATKALGYSNNYIIWKHALPHVLNSTIVALAFGFAGTILLESTLSFLGIGIPADHVSWGSLLSEARHDFTAWWLAIFPGMAIFITILTFNSIGNHIRSKIN